MVATIVCVYCLILAASSAPANNVYRSQRSRLMAEDKARALGGELLLGAGEAAVDRLILQEKRALIDSTRENGTEFLAAKSFFRSKDVITNSSLYKLIREMPKGGALHLHDLAIASLHWVVHEASYRDYAYMCTDQQGMDGHVVLKASQGMPTGTECTWTSVNQSRQQYAQGETAFDEWLLNDLSYLKIDPITSGQTVNTDWVRFNRYFSQVIGLLFHAPTMTDYFRQALVEFHADNVQYIELRSQLQGFFELDGTVHDAEWGLLMYKNVTEEFKKQHPDFIGAKIIMSGLRFNDKATVLKDVKTSMMLHQKYPDVFLGYDLVGQEDPNHPLDFYIDELMYPSQQSPPYNLPYFFHAGETNLQDTVVDQNLFDAILLNTTRIGHAFALSKHPVLMEMVKKQGIAVEVNPISNQILGLVSDLRNHAMAPLLADGFPIVISSDDPASWESSPLSHDFYVALMTMTGRDDGVKILKQLALNSIKYSAMTDSEKFSAQQKWQFQWDKFILKHSGESLMANLTPIIIIG